MSDAMGSDPTGAAGESSEGRWRWMSFGGLIAAMNSIGTCWIFVLLVLINTDIISRTVFDAPVPGVTEIVGMSIVACVFLQLAHTLRMGRLTRSDIIMSKLNAHPRLQSVLESIYHLVGACILAILLRHTWPMFLHAWQIGEREGPAGSFTAPVWPVRIILVIGCLVSVAVCLLNAWRSIQKSRSPEKATGREG